MGRPSYLLKTIAVVGMAGIGKTTIVKALYNDPIITNYFETRAFVRLYKGGSSEYPKSKKIRCSDCFTAGCF
ncbi:hypothetical protein ACJIZ3_009244 [Penstemon smallii]|uniref:NB-ARC domain-containing protein n=1 Tax=Penstemon smallii TaxID=265156 RepID=A0ABD3TDP9_9LAMI